MKALQFKWSLPRYVFSKTAGRLRPALYWNSHFSCLNYTQVPEPEILGDEWVKIKVKFGGICGSDLNLLSLQDSPTTSAFTSFPFTIGHEAVGTVTETGSKVKNLSPGDRVVTDPLLSCQARGFSDPCPSCREGDFSLCTRVTEGSLAPGLLIGACRDTGGSWSPYLVAHESQAFKLPQEVSDLNGAMVEPFSCALHSVLRHLPEAGDTVLVIGAGVIGICVVSAIRALGIPCKIVVLAKYRYQAEFAQQYGADRTILLLPGDGSFPELASFLGARLLNPVFGSPVVQGGADIVYECVGRERSVSDALRFAKSGGKVVLLGLTGLLNEMDWTTVWLNELSIYGSYAYGMEAYQGRKIRTHQLAIELLASTPLDLAPLITHRFPLDAYKHALRTAFGKVREKSMKVVFEP